MAGVYISFPFCAQKCTYCNFASGVFPAALEQDYYRALSREIAGHTWRWTPETVYLGGGTPSRISGEMIEQVLAAVPGRPWREATIEAAPGTISAALSAAWNASGINRVSLGVQSFITRELARTGRKHTAQTVVEDVAALRGAGLPNINIDLIAGLPGQTPESWRESLDWIARIEPPHVSVYMLEVDDDSRLGREIRNSGSRYGASDVPSEDVTADLYEEAVERLDCMGIRRYEISNFARTGFESLHNLKYWRLEPYQGFGPDAHSFDGTLRFQNVESPEDYARCMQAGQSPRVASTAADHDEERFFVGLRLTEGIQPSPSEWNRFREPIQRFLDDGLLAREGAALRLTNRGVLLANEVFAEFISL